MSTEIDFETRQNCIIELNSTYDRAVARRFSRLLDTQESTLGRKLSRLEILDLYQKFSDEMIKEKEILKE